MKCRWFLHCVRPARMTRRHPVLGEVPICSTCDQRVERGERHAEWLKHAADAQRFGSKEPARIADVLTEGKVRDEQ